MASAHGNVGSQVTAAMLSWIRDNLPRFNEQNCYEDVEGAAIPASNREITCMVYKYESPGSLGGGSYCKQLVFVVSVAVRFEQDLQGRQSLAIAKDELGLDDVARQVYNLLVLRNFGLVNVGLLPTEGPTAASEIQNIDNVPVIGSSMTFYAEWWQTAGEAIGQVLETRATAIAQKILTTSTGS